MIRWLHISDLHIKNKAEQPCGVHLRTAGKQHIQALERV